MVLYPDWTPRRYSGCAAAKDEKIRRFPERAHGAFLHADFEVRQEVLLDVEYIALNGADTTMSSNLLRKEEYGCGLLSRRYA